MPSAHCSLRLCWVCLKWLLTCPKMWIGQHIWNIDSIANWGKNLHRRKKTVSLVHSGVLGLALVDFLVDSPNKNYLANKYGIWIEEIYVGERRREGQCVVEFFRHWIFQNCCAKNLSWATNIFLQQIWNTDGRNLCRQKKRARAVRSGDLGFAYVEFICWFA